MTTHCLSTACIVAGQPVQPTIVCATGGMLCLSAPSPLDDGGSPVLGFVVTISDNDEDLRVLNTSYAIQHYGNLTKLTTYQ